MAKNCLVGQSGGPTCVINASLLGVIKEARKHAEIGKIFGCKNGISGVIHEQFIDLSKYDDKKLELLKQTPSAILGSVRFCLNKIEDYEKILEVFKKYEIGYFLYIGGNDSMDVVNKLSIYFKEMNYNCCVIGIPKTIDNDLLFTDHTPGYGSAIRFIANSVCQIYEDTSCYQNGRVTVVEIMGRDTGWLTAASKLASLVSKGPDLIYLPECAFNLDDFINKIEDIYQKKKKVLVCVSEGIRDDSGKFLVEKFAYNQDNDVFGHMQLGGVSSVLTHIIKERLNIPVRAIELNLLQRCFAITSSKIDVDEAIRCGSYGLRQALFGQSGKMVVIKRSKKEKYHIMYRLVDVNKIANQTKYFPKEWIINDSDISSCYISYALPLMNQEIKVVYENGLIKFFKL
ncbi:MAG: 6-phosphofructokinase [Erysipelotrichaceae bacterium]|nr:6-phosphofructokinase [Erysipelotrichaceae bacterium]